MTETTEPLSRAQKTTKLVKFFGKQYPTQSLTEVVAEFKELTDTDVNDLHAGIVSGTLDY